MAELLTLPVVCLPQPEVLFPRQQLRLIMSEIEAKEQLPRDQPMPSLVACMPMANRPQKAHGYFHVGCAAKVLSVDRKTRSGRVAILMEGAFRVSLQSVESDVAGAHVIKARRVGDGRGPSSEEKAELEAAVQSLIEACRDFLQMLSRLQHFPAQTIQRAETLLASVTALNVSGYIDLAVTVLDASYEDRLWFLEQESEVLRARHARDLVAAQTERIRVTGTMQMALPRRLRSPWGLQGARENRKADQSNDDADDDNGDDDDDLAGLRAKLKEAQLPSSIDTMARKEFRRLRRMQPAQAEYNVLRTYLETLTEVPFTNSDTNEIDQASIKRAQEILDHDHYGLDKVKRRLVEYLAVLRLKQNQQQHPIAKL